MLASIQRRLYKRSGIHFFLVLLLVGVFNFFRSYDLVALQGYFNKEKTSSSHEFVRSASLADLNFYLQYSFIPADQQMESQEEGTENHERHHNKVPDSETSLSFDLHAYNSVLENRRQQLDLALHRQSTVPLFILHHSWKSFLS